MNYLLKWLDEERRKYLNNGPARRMETETASRPFQGKTPILDAERCTGCGACADACTFDAVSFDEGTPMFDPARCEACGICIAMCQQDAIRWPLKGR